jgi:predicted transcriptional regulator
MTEVVKVQVGGSWAQDLSTFVDAWKRAESGDAREERILTFDSWEGLASLLTTERYRLLRSLHANPEKSVNALAKSLHRQYRRVHDDVVALERAGLIDRSAGEVRATADRLSAEVML